MVPICTECEDYQPCEICMGRVDEEDEDEEDEEEEEEKEEEDADIEVLFVREMRARWGDGKCVLNKDYGHPLLRWRG